MHKTLNAAKMPAEKNGETFHMLTLSLFGYVWINPGRSAAVYMDQLKYKVQLTRILPTLRILVWDSVNANICC